MAARRRAEAVRLEIPRLEPDDAFVMRLADAASASRPSAAASRPLQGLRVGLATVGVVGLSVGGAWAAGSLTEPAEPAPPRPPVTEPSRPIAPTTDTTLSPTSPSTPGAEDQPRPGGGQRDNDRGRPDRPGGPGADQGRRHGPPDERPGQGLGRDRGRQEGPPAVLGGPLDGLPDQEQRVDDGTDPGGPKGSGDRRRPDSPR